MENVPSWHENRRLMFGIPMQFSPELTTHERPYVHHVLVYLCAAPLADGEVGVSMPCEELPDNAAACRSGLLVGAWAIGGEVSLNNNNKSWSLYLKGN